MCACASFPVCNTSSSSRRTGPRSALVMISRACISVAVIGATFCAPAAICRIGRLSPSGRRDCRGRGWHPRPRVTLLVGSLNLVLRLGSHRLRVHLPALGLLAARICAIAGISFRTICKWLVSTSTSRPACCCSMSWRSSARGSPAARWPPAAWPEATGPGVP